MSDPEELAPLSRREIECLALVGLGLQSKEIGPILGIESGTVDVTLKRAGKKAGISDRRRLAALVKQRDPQLIQSTIQRLGQSQNAFAASGLVESTGVAAQDGGDRESSRSRWPVPTAERPWNDLPVWQRRLWMLVIAVGALATALLLASLSRHVLVGAPRPEELNLRKSHAAPTTGNRSGSEHSAASDRIRAVGG